MLRSAVGELKQLPFEHLIGGPLRAAIKAQALAAQTTVDFIVQVGMLPPAADAALPLGLPSGTTEGIVSNAGEVKYVTFKYKKLGTPPDTGATPQEEDFQLTVPFLTIVPIPYIRIEEITIDFRAKLDDMVTSTANTSLDFTNKVDASASGGNMFTPYRADLRVSATTNIKSSASRTATSSRHYELDIHVRATQDDMPAGLSKILDVLEKAIFDKKQA